MSNVPESILEAKLVEDSHVLAYRRKAIPLQIRRLRQSLQRPKQHETTRERLSWCGNIEHWQQQPKSVIDLSKSYISHATNYEWPMTWATLKGNTATKATILGYLHFMAIQSLELLFEMLGKSH